MTTLDYAFKYHEAGLCCIPVKCDGSKSPLIDWDSYKSTRPKRADLMKWFKAGGAGIAIVGGQVSGNLERIDFDLDGIYTDWEEAIREYDPTLHTLLLTLPLVQTPREGQCFHLYFCVDGEVGGNTKLAQMPTVTDKGRTVAKTTIETRGAGGYTIAPGSPAKVHETGREYQLIRGDLSAIPTITTEQRDSLYEVARAFNEWIPENRIHRAPDTTLETSEDMPGTDYNRKSDWRQLMIEEGWAYVFHRGDTEYWRRPGKSHGISATYNHQGHGTFYVFSSNAYPFESETSYTPFGLYTTLRHNGDYNAAATALQLEGYGSTVQTATVTHSNSWSVPIKVHDSELPERKPMPAPRAFTDLIPPTGFLRHYTDYANDLTDAPAEFHLAAGLTIVGAALGNNTAVHVWGQSVYPNIWAILLAPSGFYRKSTALGIALRIVRGRIPHLLMPNDYSREKLIDNLKANDGVGILPVYEFGEMLAKMGRDYMAGTKEMFTEIYDGNEYSRATKAGTVTIEKPALTILAASTIDWIHDRISAGDVRGGFMARFVYWPAREKNGWMGLSDPPNFALTQSLQCDLEVIHSLTGTVTIDAGIKAAFDRWVQEHEEEINKKGLPEEVQGFYTRLATYVLKFAMCYEASIFGRVGISTESLEYAIRLVDYLKSHLVQLIEEELLTTRDAKDLKKIRDLIKRQPGIDRGRLLRNSHMMTKRMDEILLTLLEAGEIIQDKIDTETKPKMVYFSADSDMRKFAK